MDDKNPLKMKVSELKAELGRRGLSQTGLKFDLAQRLQTAMDVDEFGALPLMTSPSPSSSSSILPVPGKDSIDHSDSPPLSPQSPSCESDQGGPSDEQARDLEVAARTKCSEDAPPIEQPYLGDASIAAEATTQSEGGAPAAGTADILTFEEKQMAGCGENGRDDQNKAPSNGSDDIVHTGIAVDEHKLAVDGGGGTAVELERGDAAGSNEKSKDAEECGATATTASEETPPPSFGSPENDKNNDTEEHVRGVENALLHVPPLSDSTSPPAKTPATPQKGTEQVAQEDNDQAATAVVEVEELDGKTTLQRNAAKPGDDSGQKKTAANDDAKDHDTKTSQTNRETKEGSPKSSELAAPDSLLPSSLTDRMKSREGRFRRKNEDNPDNKEGDKSKVKDETGNDGPGPKKAGGHGRDGKTDSRGGGESGESGKKGGRPPTGGACQEVHDEGKKTVEDVHRAKLMKRKERFMAPPSASSRNGLSVESGNSSLAKLRAPLTDCSPRKPPSGVPGGVETSGLASSRRQAAGEVAAKMARRSERFGVRGAGSSVTRGVTSPKACDPRGIFFAESEDTREGKAKQSPPPSGGYSFSTLPQRQKRARAPTTPSLSNNGVPAKRRVVNGDVAGALEKRASPDAVEAGSNNGEAAKATACRDMRFHAASSNGVDESPLRRGERGKPSPPSSSGKRISLGSAFVLLGVKKPPPKPSKTTTTAADKGKGTPPLPPPHLSRGGDEVDGSSTSSHPQPPERRHKEGKATKQPQQRGGPAVGTAASQVSLRRPRREGKAEKKVLEQAAKMAERRKRFAEDSRVPSFR